MTTGQSSGAPNFTSTFVDVMLVVIPRETAIRGEHDSGSHRVRAQHSSARSPGSRWSCTKGTTPSPTILWCLVATSPGF